MFFHQQFAHQLFRLEVITSPNKIGSNAALPHSGLDTVGSGVFGGIIPVVNVAVGVAAAGTTVEVESTNQGVGGIGVAVSPRST